MDPVSTRADTEIHERLGASNTKQRVRADLKRTENLPNQEKNQGVASKSWLTEKLVENKIEETFLY